MKDKIALVTGATGGIGKATALALAKTGMTVVMVARDSQRGEAARQAIIQQSGNPNSHLLLADLSRYASIQQATDQFKAQFSRLDILINNAGVYKSTRVLTSEGLETMFATNHMGYFWLTHLLRDSLSASARILNVTAPSTVALNFEDLQGEQKFSSLMAFGASKMANLLFTFALARQLEGTDITTNAIHPGLVRSGILQEANLMIRLLTRLASRAPEKTAQTLAQLATDAQFAGKNGCFFHAGKQGKELQPPAYALDPANQQRLWEISLGLLR